LTGIKIVEKPWGEEVIWASTDKYVGKRLMINKGHRMSLQYHSVKEETIHVVQGELHLQIGEESKILKPGESFHIEPKVVHRMGAVDSDVHVMEVSTPELDDITRIEDDYDR